MKTTAAEKIASLEKHLEKVKTQLTTIPERRKDQVETYKQWLSIEIKKTEASIARLKS